jgi:hypothetical protein
MPSFPKKAIVGYYLGSLGEMTIPSTSFTLVDANTGAQVFQGTLTAHNDYRRGHRLHLHPHALSEGVAS